MPTESILLADDLFPKSTKDKARSKAVRKFAQSISQLTKAKVDFVYAKKSTNLLNKSTDQLDKINFLFHKELQTHQDKVMSEFDRPGEFIAMLGNPVDAVLKRLKKNKNTKVLVMGTSLRMGLNYLMLGSVAEEVMRQCQRPVFILGPEAQKQNLALNSKHQLKIFLATDLSTKSRAIESYALSFAKKYDAQVTLYHSLSESIASFKETAYVTDYAETSIEQYTKELQKFSTEALKKKSQQFSKNGVSCSIYIEDKNLSIGKSILKHSQGSDFIFMGTQTHDPLITTFIGSTLRTVLAQAKIPIVSVHFDPS